MNLVKLVKQSEQIVNESSISEGFRAIAYKTILEFLLSNNGISTKANTDRIDSSKKAGTTVIDSGDYGDFIIKKQPKNDYETIACIVFHLTGGIVSESVSREELLEFIHQNPGNLKGLNNLSGVIRHTRGNPQYGYIETDKDVDEPSYRLSARGKQMVDRLPDREVKKGKKTKTTRK